MAGRQKKVIANYIETRVNHWAWSFRDNEVLAKVLDFKYEEGKELSDADKLLISNFQQQIIDNTIVTGGAIASMLLDEPVNDLDIYIQNKETATKISWYYLHLMIKQGSLTTTDFVPAIKVIDNNTNGVAIFIKSQGVTHEDLHSSEYRYFELLSENALDEFFEEYRKNQAKEPKPHSVKFISSNAISLHNGIQIVLRFCGSPEQIHENYDFVHATNYWSTKTGLVYRAEALQALLEKRLVYVGSKFPVCSMFRLRKFINRGFRITAGEMTKIAYDISKLDMDDPAVLHDQLIGVDYAYFRDVISKLRDRKSIDRTYLFSLLNEIFDDPNDVSGEPTTSEG